MTLRGHPGSELQRRAAAILSIERDENPQISVVKALKVREGSPPDVPLVRFSWNKEQAMHVYLMERFDRLLFNVCKRTLQRYRTLGSVPAHLKIA
jgi:hypothetical protein